MKHKFIDLKTAIPGPKSQALMRRKDASIPRGPFNTMKVFAESGKGALLTDVDGNTFLDFAGALGSMNAGHRPEKVVQAIKEQLDSYIHPCFHVMMYEPYIKLAEKLNEITPGSHVKKTFFLNSGAEAVENAVKIARKYTGRKGIISFERGFHGRTYMAMSLTSKVKPYKFGFGPFPSDTYKLPYPDYYQSGQTAEEHDKELLKKFETYLLAEVSPEEVAAVIMEPVQGEGGFNIPSGHFVKGVKSICEEHGILFIADEVQTGFGRTGKLFAMEHHGVVPDLITMSKSIAAGFPISAVSGRSEIMDVPNAGEIGGTYGGSPLGCAAALAVIEQIEEENLLENAQSIGIAFTERFAPLKEQIEQVGDVRNLGAMCAIEIVEDKTTKKPAKRLVQQILERCHENGLVLMSAGLHSNVIRLLTPLVITEEQLDEGFEVLEEAIVACSNSLKL
ncbi:4-aminobutyrate aminotransferase/(S)-3-amino-2-methylpropionate transaminase [Peribacillus cavernae]|nr:4-aminobutyrate aminotransferase/(S)-3-amino-2-methylpropionate transaminase [Peribacillus cavernae]